MKTVLIALGASLAMTGSTFAMDGSCMGSKAYTADAGKQSKPATAKTADAAQPQAPAATVAPKTADATTSSATPKKPS